MKIREAKVAAFRKILGQAAIWGATLIVLLLPALFNPFSAPHFEPPKILFFHSTILAILFCMALSTILHLSVLQKGVNSNNYSFKQIWLMRFDYRPIVPILIYVAVYMWSTFNSVDRQLSLWGNDENFGAFTFLGAIAFYFIVSTKMIELQQVERLTTSLVAGTIPVVCYGFIQYLGFDAIQWHSDSVSPIHSTLGRSIFLGAYLSVVAPITLSKVINGTAESKCLSFFYLVILFLQIICLFLTLARGAALGLVGGLAIYFWIMYFRHVRMITAGVIVFIVVAICILLFAIIYTGVFLFPTDASVPSMSNLIRYRFDSNMIRLVTWQETLKLIPDRWLFGYGPETFALALTLRNPSSINSWSDYAHLTDPHNLFLYQLTSVGVAGLLAFLWIVVTFFKTLLYDVMPLAQYRSQQATIAALVGAMTAYLIQAQFNPEITVLIVLFWLLMALGESMYRFTGNSERIGRPMLLSINSKQSSFHNPLDIA